MNVATLTNTRFHSRFGGDGDAKTMNGERQITPLEYMNKMLTKQKLNLEKETARNAPKDVLRHVKKQIGYYEVAVAALEKESGNERA